MTPMLSSFACRKCDGDIGEVVQPKEILEKQCSRNELLERQCSKNETLEM